MSIEGLAAFPPEPGTKYVETNVQPAPLSPHSEIDSKGVAEETNVRAGSPPEDATFRKSPKTPEIPEDVVELHEDSEVKNQLIVEYLDQAHNVILQVPSDEELAVERGIAQELVQTAKQRSSESAAATPNKGEPAHGD